MIATGLRSYMSAATTFDTIWPVSISYIIQIPIGRQTQSEGVSDSESGSLNSVNSNFPSTRAAMAFRMVVS